MAVRAHLVRTWTRAEQANKEARLAFRIFEHEATTGSHVRYIQRCLPRKHSNLDIPASSLRSHRSRPPPPWRRSPARLATAPSGPLRRLSVEAEHQRGETSPTKQTAWCVRATCRLRGVPLGHGGYLFAPHMRESIVLTPFIPTCTCHWNLPCAGSSNSNSRIASVRPAQLCMPYPVETLQC